MRLSVKVSQLQTQCKHEHVYGLNTSSNDCHIDKAYEILLHPLSYYIVISVLIFVAAFQAFRFDEDYVFRRLFIMKAILDVYERHYFNIIRCDAFGMAQNENY